MTWTYTKKAECDGVGQRGDPVPEGVGPSMAYLQLHGYVEHGPGPVEAESGALDSPAEDGAVRRARKVRP